MKINFNKIITAVKTHLFSLIERIKKEPVLVRTFLTILIAGGFIEISSAKLDQIDAIVLAVVILLGGAATRRNVKPLSQEEKSQRRQNRRILNKRRKTND
jgi:hypothetical protein